MEDLLNQVLVIVRPDSLGDIFIYIIFFLSLVMLVVVPEKNETSLYLVFAVILFCIVDLLRQTGDFPVPETDNCGFLTFLLHVGMGAFPWIAAGMTRRQGKKGGMAIPVGGLLGLIGFVYAFGAFALPGLFYPGTPPCPIWATF